MYSNCFEKNGEIIDIQTCGEDAFVAVNISRHPHPRFNIPNYNHVQKEGKEIKVINQDLGNSINIIQEKKLAIIRNPNEGYYLYSVKEARRISPYFKELYFVNFDNQELLYAQDDIRNCLGDYHTKLCSLLNIDGSFKSDIYDATGNNVYSDINTEEDYLKLKDKLANKRIITESDRTEVYKKLLKMEKERGK